MNLKHIKIIYGISLFLFIFLYTITYGEVIWNNHPLIDGGTIQLPSNFSAIQTAFATEQTKEENLTQYTQRLINAKAVHNDVVCSLKISRTWKNDINNELLIEESPEDLLDKLSQNMLSLYSTQEQLKVLLPIRYEIINSNKCVRFSIAMAEQSRLDVFALYKDGFLFHGSTVYNRLEEKYWANITNQILEKWTLGNSLTASSEALSDKLSQQSKEWTSYELDGGSILWLPSNCLCVSKNSKIEYEDSYGFQRLIDLRPSNYEGDVSTVNIIRITDTQKNSFSFDEIKECEDAMTEVLVEGISEIASKSEKVLGPENINLSNKRIIHRKYSVKIPFGEMNSETYTFGINENIYIFMVTYKGADLLLWKKLINQIFDKWEFSNKKGNSEVSEYIIDKNSINNSPSYYRNSQSHYSLTLPSDWEKIPEDVLKQYVEAIDKASSTSNEFQVAFQKKADEYFTYPYIMTKELDLGDCPPSEFQKFMLSEEGEKAIEEGIGEAKDKIEDHAKLGSFQHFILDEKKHTLTSYMLSNVEGVGIVKGKFVGFIGKDTVVWIYCYSLLEDYDFYDKEYFTAIIDSFSFDFAYRYEDYEDLKKKDDSLSLFEKSTKLEGGTPDDPLNIRTTNDMGRSYNTFRKTDNSVASRSSPDYTGVIVIGVLLLLSVFVIIYFATRSSKKSELAVPSVTETTGSEELYRKNIHNQENGIKHVSTRNIDPHYLGRIVVCANCERNIGKIEASFDFNGNLVCIQCQKKLLEQA
ncbi:MAG: hypothetical protein JXI43_05525 [Tissierellales bacterium]|nr:hypothetical protein [Tissierellales bacterium]